MFILEAVVCKRIFIQILNRGDSIEDSRNPLGLKKLCPGGIVVAAQEEELGQDLRGKGAGMEGGTLLVDAGHAVAADWANLAFLVLVVMAADAAGVLPLSLPHVPIRVPAGGAGGQRRRRNRPMRRRETRSEKEGGSSSGYLLL